MIAIIDYNLGNIGSVQNIITKVGYESIITNNIDDILRADKLILPGVGSFDNGIINLKSLKLIEPLTKKVLIEKTPILGICLGMQLFCKNSGEGQLPGLNFIDAEVINFNCAPLKIPHMGWNTINIIKKI
jgi:imidazole glycerol-phosphate synthase subunit HisH